MIPNFMKKKLQLTLYANIIFLIILSLNTEKLLADEIFKKKTAVYFLYKKKQLYYVGKAKNALRRIQQHLADEHAGNWNFFSVIMPRKSNHLADLERFAIMAGRPTSNKQRPRLSRKKASRQLIKKEIRKNRREASKLEKLMKETL